MVLRRLRGAPAQAERVADPPEEAPTVHSQPASEPPPSDAPADPAPPESVPPPPQAADEPPVSGEPSPLRAPSIAFARSASAPHVILTTLVTMVFLMFVLIEPTPRWLLLFGAVVALMGTDGVLRMVRREPFRAGEQTAPYLFLPALYVLGTPLLIELNARGFLVVPLALLAGGAFGALLGAETGSVRERAPEYPLSRLIATGMTYFVGFALFSLTYELDVGLVSSIVAVAVISAMLGIELLREGQVDPVETLVFAAVTGLIVGEVRWALHYLPVESYAGGLTLLLAFFFVTGLLQSHLTRQLDAIVAAEYAAIVGLGLLVVVAARASGVA